MALSEIKKKNIQKWETKNEPQTNGSCKIRQIVIKMMEYAHIHPWAKSKQPSKNKAQINLVNRGNQKLYLPVKNKITKEQTGKQN